jgi:hypothetical protein
VSEFLWMEDSLRLMTLDELRDCGVTVYQTPKIPKRARLVNLCNGALVDYASDGGMPPGGWYARCDEVMSLGRRFDVRLVELDRRLEPVWEELAESTESLTHLNDRANRGYKQT